MKAEEMTSGYYVIADNRYVRCYNTIEECKSHIKFQKEQMQSNAVWKIAKVQFKSEIIEQ